MKLTILLLIMALALPGAAADNHAGEQAIRHLTAGFANARNAFDFDKLSRFYAEDAELTQAGQAPITGRAAIRANWSGIQADRTARAERIVTEIRFIRPDVAIVQADVVYAGAVQHCMGTIVRFGKTFVLTADSGHWQIALDQTVLPEQERSRIEQFGPSCLNPLSSQTEKTPRPDPGSPRPASAPSGPARAN
jgi:uncharacterized protein (TIGR02246 family)